MATVASVVNTAFELIGAQTRITALNDGTNPANAANVIYIPTVQLMLRALEPDFARTTATLALSGAGTPLQPWSYEYLYPSTCLRLLQVRPASSSYDHNDPQPVRSAVGFDTISAVATKVILTNQVSALASFITSAVTEAQWDDLFADAVSRRLASPLAMALSGRPDFARELLDEASQVAAICDGANESMVRSA